MAKKIGIFEKEQQVIDTIHALEQMGFEKAEMKIFAKDAQHSRRIEADTDIHVDEVQELAETRAETTGNEGGIPLFGATALPVSGMSGVGGWNAGPIAATSFLAGDGLVGDEDGIYKSLQALGLDSKESSSCLDAIRSGSTIVVVETDESKSLLDKDGGPELSTLGIAEGIFRQNNALDIIIGS